MIFCYATVFFGAFERLEPDELETCAVSRAERIATKGGRSSG